MRKKQINNNTILFIIFFIITIGNGAFINNIFQFKIELIGLGLILLMAFIKTRKNFITLINDITILIFSFILTIGPIILNIPLEAKTMIFLSSTLLMSYSKFSKIFLSNYDSIKVMGNSLLCGMIFNSLIGVLTGTLGLSIGSNEAIVKILFQSGIATKNYCGGIWLMIFICKYIYYFNNKQKKYLLALFLLLLLILLSGSKGALFLAILFVILINIKSILIFKKKHNFIFYTISIPLFILFFIIIYKYILINIPTYAYRIRGMNKLMDLLTKDYNRFIYGFSDIAYANTGYDYTINMRNFFGWEASVEMAYLNIFIKNGFIGFLIYIHIFMEIIKSSKKKTLKTKNITLCLLIIMILSGFTETYIASIHYVVGPVMYCIIFGLLNFKEIDNIKKNGDFYE